MSPHRSVTCPDSLWSCSARFLPLQPGKFQPRPEWRQAAAAREDAYAKRHIKKAEQLSRGSKNLPPLQPGDHVAVQNQTGTNPRQWSQTGVVIEVGPHNSYHISIDGSRTVTKRNRQFLRKIIPFHDSLPKPPLAKKTVLSTKPDNVLTMPPPLPMNTSTPAAIRDQHRVPDNSVPDNVPEADQAIETDQSVDKETEDKAASHPSTSSPPTPSKPRLPPHLRERWIVAPRLPNQEQVPTHVPGSLAPVQYNPTLNYPYQTVAPLYPNVLPYMMPQQHNPMMNQYPMMYQNRPYQ